MCRKIWKSYILLHLIIPISSVLVDFGHWKEPFVKEEGGTTILKNSNIVVQIRCKANYPTKWIFNADDKSRASGQTWAIEWTDRIISGSIDDGVFEDIAWVQLQYSKMTIPDKIVCAAVNDPSKQDRITVSITPIDADGTVAISQSPGDSVMLDTQNGSVSSSCEIQFLVQDRGANGLFWRCESRNGTPGKIVFRNCRGSLECENYYRNIKQGGSCVRKIEKRTGSIEGWTTMENKAFESGNAICSVGPLQRAQTYVFSKPNESNGLRNIEFFRPNSSDLVWITSEKDVYFTGEDFSAECHIAKYGFSFGSYGFLSLNGSRVKKEGNKEVEEDKTWVSEITYNLLDPGIYEVQCLAPVWDSKEWLNKTKSFNVTELVPPYLDSDVENVTFVEGDSNKKIVCRAEGNPKPEISWGTTIPLVTANGDTLYFQKVTPYLEGPYLCTATNRGGWKMKRFNVFVTLKTTKQSQSSGMGIYGLIGIVVSVILVLIIAIGFTLFYCKFMKLSGQIAYLSYEEVEHFREGIKQKMAEGELVEYDNNACIHSLPYNSKYEVSRENITIDEDKVLGAGAYGTVIKGTLLLPSGLTCVAFKTVPRDVDLSYFKALLSELKVLAFIGEHPNIVCLVGAWTGNIRRREIYVGVELCKQSLLEFLREHASEFANHNKSEKGLQSLLPSDDSYENVSAKYSIIELLQWSHDVATGLDFLASKKVIHGDLSARNVLLSFDMKAKICDFGLARQLIDYNYIKSEACPLPWKWMAIESLTQMKFSTKSDCWSYGILLWEIFSLGNTPYPGMSWSTDFVDKLQSGLRMTCPHFADEVVYDIMINCWRQNPKERPQYLEIMKILSAQAKLYEPLSSSSSTIYTNFAVNI